MAYGWLRQLSGDIKMDCKESGWGRRMDWIYLAQDVDELFAFVKIVMKFYVP